MSDYLSKTKAWIEQFVIGLHLCPFARKPFEQDLIRYALVESNQLEDLLQRLLQELHILQVQPASEVETTIIVHPNCLQYFYDYLDFLALGEEVLVGQKLEGIIQIASFHPDYQFGDLPEGVAGHYRNRSPYPMLHLIREESVEKAVQLYPNSEQIPEVNIKTMEDLGLAKIRERLSKL